MIGKFRQDSKSSLASLSFSKKSYWNKASIVWFSAARLNDNRFCEQHRQNVSTPELFNHCIHRSFVHIGNRIAGIAASEADKRANVESAFCGQGEKGVLREQIQMLNGHQKSP